MNRPKSLAELLRSGDIEKLKTEAKQRAQFTLRVKSLLPAEEAEHLVSASTDAGGRLVLAMDSAAWAARVRFRTEEFAGRRLRVKVTPRQDR